MSGPRPVSFKAGTSYATGVAGATAAAITVGDFNGDNKLDYAVVVANGTNPGSVCVRLSDGLGSFGTPTIYAVYRFALVVYDVATGQTAVRSEVGCDVCSQGMALDQLGEAVRGVLVEANNRPRGLVAITSTPPWSGCGSRRKVGW